MPHQNIGSQQVRILISPVAMGLGASLQGLVWWMLSDAAVCTCLALLVALIYVVSSNASTTSQPPARPRPLTRRSPSAREETNKVATLKVAAPVRHAYSADLLHSPARSPRMAFSPRNSARRLMKKSVSCFLLRSPNRSGRRSLVSDFSRSYDPTHECPPTPTQKFRAQVVDLPRGSSKSSSSSVYTNSNTKTPEKTIAAAQTSAEDTVAAAQISVEDTGNFTMSVDQKRACDAMRDGLRRRGEQIPPFPELIGDMRLLRFLEGNKMNVEEATEMFSTMLKLRAEHNADHVRNELAAYWTQDYMKLDFTRIDGGSMLAVRENMEKYTAERVNIGTDKEGNIINVVRYGYFDVKGLMANLTQAELLRNVWYQQEYICRTLDERTRTGTASGGMCKMYVIADVSKLTFGPWAQWNMAAVRFMKVVALLKDAYPEMGRRVHIVNAPTWIGYVWKILLAMGFIPERSLKKFKFFSISEKDKALAAILENADADQIPQFLGGTKPDARCMSPIGLRVR